MRSREPKDNEAHPRHPNQEKMELFFSKKENISMSEI